MVHISAGNNHSSTIRNALSSSSSRVSLSNNQQSKCSKNRIIIIAFVVLCFTFIILLRSNNKTIIHNLNNNYYDYEPNEEYIRNNDEDCHYYLAESAIPFSGLGLFTSINISIGQEAQSMPDICIYVADTPLNTSFETHSWANDVFIGQFEGYKPRAACEGFATLFNSMPEKDNVRTSRLVSMKYHTNGGLHRYKHPGAGSITNYYGISSKAARDIIAGSELTINYGDWQYNPMIQYKPPIRSIQYLQKHGMCIDNIKIQTATDPSMGRGAFAKRFIPTNTIIAPAPIQAFPNRSVFATASRQDDQPEALFVNYCFQIPTTDILLYPYGPGVNLINHGSGPKANVKVEWSHHYMSHISWLQLPLEQFWQMYYPGAILFDIIAIRDIQAGEELFLDYGTEWENAWQNHVARWKPLEGPYTYVEEVIHPTKPYKTISEQLIDPYSPNLKTICHTSNWVRGEYTILKWRKPPFDFPEGIAYCNLLNRTYDKTMGEYIYNVSLLFNPMIPDKYDKLRFIDIDVPHSAISFVDKPYTSDLHLKNSFRQPIGLPYGLVPELWKAKKKK